jgi:hypothetical protein
MRGKATWIGLAVMMALIGIFLVGCATGPSNGPAAGKTQDDLLKQAGFRTQAADNPQRLAYIKTLPAKKVVLNQYQEKPLYLVCTDPDAKQCFLGDQAAYERYQQLAIQQSISEDRRTVQEHRYDPEALQMWANSQGGG